MTPSDPYTNQFWYDELAPYVPNMGNLVQIENSESLGPLGSPRRDALARARKIYRRGFVGGRFVTVPVFLGGPVDRDRVPYWHMIRAASLRVLHEIKPEEPTGPWDIIE